MDKPKQKILKTYNSLKKKIGLDPNDQTEGFLDPADINKADALISEICQESEESIRGLLIKLEDKWTCFFNVSKETARSEKDAEDIFVVAHEIKDIGAMCGYNLIAYFAESLRDYVEETDLNIEAKKVIVQAHIDAMKAAHKNKIKDTENSAAAELKNLVKVAINQYD